ncbi:MAG TPA: NAD(P)/FAD-dependent oxidoreductase [Leptolyngbyaceae cyanobacterium]
MDKIYDVIIIGTGPAGITAANLLAKKGWETLIVHQSPQQKLQLPETFSGISRDLLTRLDIEQEINKAIATPKPIHLVSASDNFIYHIGIEPNKATSSHYGMSLNREILERILLERAIGRGATYLPTTVVKDFIFVDNQVTGIKCHTPQGNIEYSAKVVIDARGKETPLLNHFKVNSKDKNLEHHIAVFCEFTGASFTEIIPNNSMLGVTLDQGYILAMPIANNRVSIMAVLEGENFSNNCRNWEKKFQEAVENWQPLAQAIQTAKKLTPILPITNHNWECERFSGKGFLVVGDSVAFLDPFSCNGIAIGMNSGEIAADFLTQKLTQSHGCWEAENLSIYDQQIRDLINKWKRVWGIENLSLSSMDLLKQSLKLLNQLQFLKLGALNENWSQNMIILASGS